VLASSIGWILIVSGIVTAVGGLAGLLFPRAVLQLGFGVQSDGAIVFFVRHWGLLIALVGAMTVYGASYPAVRPAVLTAAVIEKFAIVALVFFGPIKRTLPMTVIAATDGLFAVLYVTYLAGL
jgi:hypothetical protein